MNLSQLEGMNVNEARLFTLEARLRSEENSKLQIFNQIVKLIETKFTKLISPVENRSESLTPQIPLGRYSATPMIRNSKEDANYSRSPDSERRVRIENSESVRISRRQSPLNFSQITEEKEKTKFYKEKRNNRETPSSQDLEQNYFPVISKKQTMRL